MEFLAHRIPETGRHQTLEEHSKTVSLLAKKYGVNTVAYIPALRAAMREGQ